MKWVKTCSGRFINLNHVAQFTFRRGGDETYQVEICIEYPGERAETHIIYKTDHADLGDMIINQHNQFCPSPPGYFVLSYYKKDEDSEEAVHRDAILGWVLDTDLDGYHHVITTWDNHKTLGPTTAVLCADGTVVVPGISRYPDEETWLREMRNLPADVKAA